MQVGAEPWNGSLWLPFESGRHIDTDAIAVETSAWLKSRGLLRPANAKAFERARFTELAGRVYYDFDRSELRLASDFISALFVLDDLMDDASDERTIDNAPAMLECIRLSAHSGRPHESNALWVTEVGEAMADLTRRLAARGCSLTAYLREIDRYLDGVRVEAADRAKRAAHSSVEDYASARVDFSAVYACIELGLALRGRALNRGYSDPPNELARLANLSVSWVNDVFSWPKERALGERSNLVLVLREAEGLSEREALTRACQLCDSVVADFMQARHSSDDQQTARLLEAWMRGNGDWHQLATDRYRDHVSVVPHAA